MNKKGTNVNNAAKARGPVSMRLQFSDREQFEVIKRASTAEGMSFSAFCRFVSAAVARRVLRVSGEPTIGDRLVDTPSTSQEQKSA